MVVSNSYLSSSDRQLVRNRWYRTLISLAFLCGVVVCVSGCSKLKPKPTVSIDKYVTIKTEGYDSLGTASLEFDENAFEQDYADKIKFDLEEAKKNETDPLRKALLSDDPEDIEGQEWAILYAFCISGELDRYKDLKNGDVIKLTWKCDDEYAEKYFHCKLDHSDIEYTVSGLTEIPSVDPFEYLDVSFSGISPSGQVKAEKKTGKEDVSGISFSVDKQSGLKNGDVVTITASLGYSDKKTFADQYGFLIAPTEKQYTVENLAYYVTDMSEIPDSELEKIKEKFRTIYNEKITPSWDKTVLERITPVATYFLSSKTARSSEQNFLYVLYEVTMHNVNFGEKKGYWYGKYADFTIDEKGDLFYDADNYTYSTASSSLFGTSGDYLDLSNGYYTAGFESVSGFEGAYIKPKEQDYTTLKTEEKRSDVEEKAVLYSEDTVDLLTITPEVALGTSIQKEKHIADGINWEGSTILSTDRDTVYEIYHLNGEFKKLHLFYKVNRELNRRSGTFSIWDVDNMKSLYSKDIDGDLLGTEVDLDVTGVKYLYISYYGNGNVMIHDLVASKNKEAEIERKIEVDLPDKYKIDLEHCEAGSNVNVSVLKTDYMQDGVNWKGSLRMEGRDSSIGDHHLYVDNTVAEISYYLGGKYKKLHLSFGGYRDKVLQGRSFEVWDPERGLSLYTEEYNSIVMAKDVDIDVTGINYICIKAIGAHILLKDAYLLTDEKAEVEKTNLLEMPDKYEIGVDDAENGLHDFVNEIRTDLELYGVNWNGSLEFKASYGQIAYIVVYLGGKYSNLHFLAAQEAARSTCFFTVTDYESEKEIYSHNFVGDSKAVEVNIDVSGLSYVKIQLKEIAYYDDRTLLIKDLYAE